MNVGEQKAMERKQASVTQPRWAMEEFQKLSKYFVPETNQGFCTQ